MEVKSETLARSKNGPPLTAPEPRENLLGRPVSDLERLFYSIGEKPYRGRQVADWIYGRGVSDFASMTNLPATLRSKLAERVVIGVLDERSRRVTAHPRTPNVAFELPGGGIIASVHMSTASPVTCRL